MRWFLSILLVLSLGFTVGCSREPSPSKGLSVLFWNLADCKPGQEAQLQDAFQHLDPTILALLGPDSSSVNRVSTNGFSAVNRYPGRDEAVSLVASTSPISTEVHDDSYSIKGESTSLSFKVVEMGLEVGGERVRLLFVGLKSKAYHPLGQSEMRRNEARLVSQLVRKIQAEHDGEPVILCGSLNDLPASAPLKQLTGTNESGLRDQRPEDAGGLVWTFFDSETDEYLRYDYILCTPEAEALIDSIDIPDIGEVQAAHRPIRIRFK